MLPFVLVFCFPFVCDHHVSGVVLIGSYASLVAFLHCRCSDAKMAILIVASRDESEMWHVWEGSVLPNLASISQNAHINTLCGRLHFDILQVSGIRSLSICTVHIIPLWPVIFHKYIYQPQ